MRNLLLATSVLLAPFFVSGQLVAKNLKAGNGVSIGFYQFTPSNYNSNTSARYPLIIFLHGIGERGNGTTELSRIAGPGIPGYIRNHHETMTFTWNGKTESFIVLAPQLSKNYGSWQDFYVDEMLKYAKANLRIDPNRVILTGLSLGGGGVWHYASSSSSNASQFAGIAPVCGTCAMVNAANISGAGLPVWAFHASDDHTVGAGCTLGNVANINKNHPQVTPLVTIYASGGHGIWDKAYSKTYDYQLPSIYEWMLAQNKSLPKNKKPVAKAGNTLSISTALGGVTLSATGSYDPDGSIVRTIWRKIGGPGGGLLNAASNLVTGVTGLTNPGAYQFELEVVDNRAEWSKDTVTVNVTKGGIITPPLPTPVTSGSGPTARAGNDVTITAPATSVNLNGGNSSDASGKVSAFNWSQAAGPSQASIAHPSSAATSVSKLVPGTYQFKLTVTNDKKQSASDVVVVMVKPQSGGNKPPVARAGSDITIKLPAKSAPLDGRWSSDPERALSSFRWTKIYGPSQYSISSRSVNGSLSAADNLVLGTYAFRLEVTDNGGLKDADTVTVTVQGPNTITTSMSPKLQVGNIRDSVVLSPNPASTTVRLEFNSQETGRITINLYDFNGRILSTTSAQKSSAVYTQTYTVGHFANGTYYVGVITQSNKRFITKFIKQ